MYPIFPLFLNRTAEIIMLSCLAVVTIVTLIKCRKVSGTINYKNYPVIWVVPLILHLFDIILAFSMGIKIAYIPVLLFAAIHLGYIGFYLLRKSKKRGALVIVPDKEEVLLDIAVN